MPLKKKNPLCGFLYWLSRCFIWRKLYLGNLFRKHTVFKYRSTHSSPFLYAWDSVQGGASKINTRDQGGRGNIAATYLDGLHIHIYDTMNNLYFIKKMVVPNKQNSGSGQWSKINWKKKWLLKIRNTDAASLHDKLL